MRVNVRFSEVNTKIDVDFAENHSRINADFGAVTEIKDPEAENVASVLSELHTENLTDLVTDLHECRRAITYRGGEISATSNFKEVAEKIVTLPASSSIGTVIDEDVSLRKLVPSNSTKYCYLKSIGGMTYKCNNLIPFPYYGGKGVGYTVTTGGITFTVNADRSITINGAGGGCSFILADYLDLPSASYTISVEHISGEWTGNQTNSPYISGTGLGSQTYPTATRPKATINTKPVWFSINVPTGAIVNNVTLKIMLNAGSTALPYEDYYAGLKDTKPTAIRSYAANGDLIKEITIPEALQGTGKGVTGASDTMDFEYGKKITKVKTIALGSQSWQLGNYRSDTGIVSTYTYSVNDYDVALRSQSLCSHLSFTAIQHNILGIYLGDTANGLKRTVRVNVLADVVGLTADEYTDTAVIRAKIVSWLKENNVTLTYAVEEPTETDIDTSSFDNLIEVEGGGALEFVTDSGEAPNSAVIYQTII